MSEKVIGIKLADGSFYPIMKEGFPVNKTLELTTVRDDQTTVQLNLYRSETGTMEGAEYVDSLMIENLIPHPKLEPSFNLTLTLDENNVLSATIDDPETGITSNSTVSLVTLSEENQNVDDDFSISSPTESEEFDTMTDFDDDFDFIPDPIADAPQDDSPLTDDDFEFIPDPIADAPQEDSPLSDDDFDFIPDPIADAPQEDSPLTDDDFEFTESTLPDFSEISDDPNETDETPVSDEDDAPFTISSLPDFDDIPEIAEYASPDDPTFFDLPEFDEIPELADNPYFGDDDFELPEFSSAVTAQDSLSEPNTAFNDLDDLYEETIRENERGQKRYLIPVIICVLCSIICLGVLIYMLFFAPKLNAQKQAENQAIIQEILPQNDSKNQTESTQIDPNAAKYDQVVVTTVEVVPEPILPKEEKAAEVMHKVRWGDTLWDLSNTYYKTPWLYKKIARANYIKNPDLIISGTTIVIPPK